MDRFIVGLLLINPTLAFAVVDQSSASYKFGRYAGYAFMAVFAYLIYKKIFK